MGTVGQVGILPLSAFYSLYGLEIVNITLQFTTTIFILQTRNVQPVSRAIR